MIKIHIESHNGHDTIDAQNTNQAIQEVAKQVRLDKWATIESQNGTTELITKKDVPTTIETLDLNQPTEKFSSEEVEFINKFKNIKSAIVSSKAKGG